MEANASESLELSDFLGDSASEPLPRELDRDDLAIRTLDSGPAGTSSGPGVVPATQDTSEIDEFVL